MIFSGTKNVRISPYNINKNLLKHYILRSLSKIHEIIRFYFLFKIVLRPHNFNYLTFNKL